MGNKEHFINRLFSAFFLIAIGIIFLLNTTGVVSWAIWGGFALLLVKIWPIFLILVGLQIILGKSAIVQILFSLVWFVIFGIGFFIGILNYADETPFIKELKTRLNWLNAIELVNNEPSVTTEQAGSSDQEYLKQRILINLTSGKLILSERDSLEGYTISSKYLENYGKPEVEENITDNLETVNFSQYFKTGLIKLSADLEYTMELGRLDIPAMVELNITAGNSELEFEQKKIESLDVSMVAGDMDLTFSKESMPNEINITLTAGSLNLDLPDDVAVSVSNSSVAGTTTVFGEKLKSNDSYSINKSNTDKVKIVINQTAGSIQIN